MQKLLHGHLAYWFFFWLFLSVSISGYGVTDLQLENLMLEFELNYQLLSKETSILRLSFSESQKSVNDLKLSNEKLLRNLDEQTSISQDWKVRHESQVKVSNELTASLTEAMNLSKKAEATYKREKIKAYLVGGGVGLILGGLVTRILVGVLK